MLPPAWTDNILFLLTTPADFVIRLVFCASMIQLRASNVKMYQGSTISTSKIHAWHRVLMDITGRSPTIHVNHVTMDALFALALRQANVRAAVLTQQ